MMNVIAIWQNRHNVKHGALILARQYITCNSSKEMKINDVAISAFCITNKGWRIALLHFVQVRNYQLEAHQACLPLPSTLSLIASQQSNQHGVQKIILVALLGACPLWCPTTVLEVPLSCAVLSSPLLEISACHPQHILDESLCCASDSFVKEQICHQSVIRRIVPGKDTQECEKNSDSYTQNLATKGCWTRGQFHFIVSYFSLIARKRISQILDTVDFCVVHDMVQCPFHCHLLIVASITILHRPTSIITFLHWCWSRYLLISYCLLAFCIILWCSRFVPAPCTACFWFVVALWILTLTFPGEMTSCPHSAMAVDLHNSLLPSSSDKKIGLMDPVLRRWEAVGFEVPRPPHP